VKRDPVCVSRSRSRLTPARRSIIGEPAIHENKNRKTSALALTIDHAKDTLYSPKSSQRFDLFDR
jgi:hypothetical protein